MPVLGVEHEEQPVEESEAGAADLGEVVGIRDVGRQRVAPDQGLQQPREDLLEHPLAEVTGDLLFPVAALVAGELQEWPTTRVVPVGEECLTPEEEEEDAKEVLSLLDLRGCQLGLDVGGGGKRGEVDLQELLGPRASALPVEPPVPAIGEDAPLDPAVGSDLRARQVTKHLSRGSAGIDSVTRLPTVERALPSLRLDEAGAIPVARVVAALLLSGGLGVGGGEEELVGDVGTTGSRCTLLRQDVFPSERGEHRQDEVLLGDRFVGRASDRKVCEELPD